MEITQIQHATTAEAQAAFEAQDALAPGTPGYWKVWGAGVNHVCIGDLVGTLVDGELRFDLITDLFPAKAAPLRRGFVSDGSQFTLGVLVPVVVLRWSTRNTLASP